MYNVMVNELYKILFRKKIYVFMGILLFITLCILASTLLTSNLIHSGAMPKDNLEVEDELSRSISSNYGQTFPLILFDGVASIVLPVFIILLITSLVTDEYIDGSLELPLLRPISRTRLLLGKIAALIVILLSLLTLILIMGYGMSILFFGWGDEFLIKGKLLSPGQGVMFTILVYGLSIFSYTSFAMMVLLFAILIPNSGSVVAIGTGILFTSLIAGQVAPQIYPYLITSYFNTFDILVSTAKIGYTNIGLWIIPAYGLSFYFLSATLFKKKDFL